MTFVAVCGASGKTGRALVGALRRRGAQVRGLGRPAVDLGTGAGLEPALSGCEALYLMAPNVHPDEPGLVARTLDAARRAGVQRVVYHSVAQPYAPAMPHHLDKAAGEDLVRRSGLAWSVLQPCAYLQNLVPALLADPPALTVPYSVDVPFGFVDLDDVAEAAARVLTEPGHSGATYELGGPRPLTVRDVAGLAAEVLGRPVPATATSQEDWSGGPGRELPAPARERLLAMFASYDEHGLLTGSLPLRALLGRPPSTAAETLSRELSVR